MNIIREIAKKCDQDDCRIRLSGGMTTLMAWAPVYNRNGELVNADPNTLTIHAFCDTCHTGWVVITHAGKTTITEEPK